jgi:hypothetical protein
MTQKWERIVNLKIWVGKIKKKMIKEKNEKDVENCRA